MYKRYVLALQASLFFAVFLSQPSWCGNGDEVADDVPAWRIAGTSIAALYAGKAGYEYALSACRGARAVCSGPVSGSYLPRFDVCGAQGMATFLVICVLTAGLLRLLLFPDFRRSIARRWVSLAPGSVRDDGRPSRADRIARKRERREANRDAVAAKWFAGGGL